MTSWFMTADDGGITAISRLWSADRGTGSPVICMPGMFSNRHFWVSPRGVGLGAHLARGGFDIWLVERRGTGRSPSKQTARMGLEETVVKDLPLIQSFVRDNNPLPAFLIGHSFGGVTLSIAVARTLDPTLITGMVLFASQFEVGKSSLTWPGRMFVQGVSRLAGYFPARRFGLGPENEPIAAMDDACNWTTASRSSGVHKALLSSVTCPVLGMVGAADKIDPPEGCEKFISHMSSGDKTFLVAGAEQGFAQDYDHPGIVVSQSARDEIWCRVADWMLERVQH